MPHLDVLLIALLCGAGFLLASVLWHLMVRPELVLSLVRSRSLTDLSADDAPGSARGEDLRPVPLLRWTLGALVFLTGLLAGAAAAFFAATTR